ncbi:MAG: pyridoxine 5'-phosphate synthase [Candidatus Pelagibacter bacterium]|jgi:pyridoxine 5-phosphate synthase|nr:pyridoxine 5'-phosphate synthase [Candidatus Pelagibacter bacterium]
MIRLGVNIDHVATVRNARGENYPDPNKAALIAKKSGASSITIHLREDRRHIRDKDLFKIVRLKNIRINLEMAPTYKMLKIALKSKPNFVCIVPEKRKELTTEGGLNLDKDNSRIKKIIYCLKKKGIRTSLFIEPRVRDIRKAKKLGADCVELHTGKFCNLYNLNKKFFNEFAKIKKVAQYANTIGLEVHAGHGLTYKTTKMIKKIKNIKELNIGHFIISESIFLGLKQAIINFKNILK